MNKLTFKEIYKATEEVMKHIKEPFVKNKNERAVNSAIDSAEMQGINAEESLEKELNVVSKGEIINVNKILELTQTIQNSAKTVKALKQFKEEFFV